MASIRSCVSASSAAGRAPSAGEQPVQALVERPARARGRRQVPGGAVEQLGAGVADARARGAGERVPADEALVVGRLDDRALRRADVGDDAVVAGAAASAARTAAGSAPTGAATNAASAPSSASSAPAAATSTAPTSSAASSAAGDGSNPTTSAPSRSRAASPTDPPISPTPTTAILTQAGSRAPCPPRRRRARPSPRIRRTRRRAAAAGRRRSPHRARGGPRR